MITIKAMGDICPGDKNIMGFGVHRNTLQYGPDFIFSEVRKYLAGADIALANFEGLLTTKATQKTGPPLTFCGLPEFAGAMARAGIQVLNVANNHSLEHGADIFEESINHLKRAGIAICGLRSKSTQYYSEPVCLEIQGKRLGIIGYNWVGVNNFQEADQHISQSHLSLVNYTWDRSTALTQAGSVNQPVIQDIKTLRESVDIVILIAHWGFEYIHIPPYGVMQEARSFVEAGADLVIGGHPHVLQGMEPHKKGLIFYSLGNFVFDFRAKLTRHTAILDLVFKDGSWKYRFLPLSINNRFQPCKAGSRQAQLIHSIIETSNRAIQNARNTSRHNDDELYKDHENTYKKLKLRNIFTYCAMSLIHPSLLLVIAHKIAGSLKILHARMNGQRIRW